MQWFLLASPLQASHCPFKRCRAVEELQERLVYPPLTTQQQRKGLRTFVIYLPKSLKLDVMGKVECFVVEQTTDTAISSAVSSNECEWRRKYSERKFSKNKDGESSFLQSFKDDRMTTWRFPRHSMQFSEHFQQGQTVLRCLFDGLYIDFNHFDVEWCYFLHDNRESTTVGPRFAAREWSASHGGLVSLETAGLQSRANTNRRPIKAYRCYNVTDIR